MGVMEMQKGIIELIKMEKEMEKGGSAGGKVVDPAVLQQLESNFKNLEAATHYFLAAVKTCQSTLSMFSPGQKMDDPEIMKKLEAGYTKLANAKTCKSLLKKYLTREVFDKLKDKKTKLGATLLDVIQSGVENLDSGVGLYAPDAEAYSLFAPLFDPVIEDYHVGFKQTDFHPQKNFGDVNAFINVDPEGKYVVSTRIRCGRSPQGYPFNPCLTKAMYEEMEKKVSTALAGLGGELKGTFYPLTGMSKAVQQKLIDDHFLFKEGDRFLQAVVSTTTTTRPSLSGATKRIISASSPCRWVVISARSSAASSMVPTQLRRLSLSLTTTALVSRPSAQPTLVPPSAPPSTSVSPSSLPTSRSLKLLPASTTCRCVAPAVSTLKLRVASTTSPTSAAWVLLNSMPSWRCRMAS